MLCFDKDKQKAMKYRVKTEVVLLPILLSSCREVLSCQNTHDKGSGVQNANIIAFALYTDLISIDRLTDFSLLVFFFPSMVIQLFSPSPYNPNLDPSPGEILHVCRVL